MSDLSHVDEQGRVRMVNVGDKTESQRTARAAGAVHTSEELVQRLRAGRVAKGNVFAVAQTAGIMAAKRTADLIPRCHPLQLDHIDVTFELGRDRIEITSSVRLSGRTGAEMEALTAVTVAALTIYDMCKAVDKTMVLSDIRLLEKTGGKSGTFRRESAAGEILAVCISETRGVQKKPVEQIECVRKMGIRGDAHAEDWHRQVSLLADESADIMRKKGVEIGPGDFAENILTRGIVLKNLPVGQRLRIGDSVVLEVTQIGKECHHDCAIYQATGDCVMPREGIFCIVVEEGPIRAGDRIDVLPDSAGRPE